MKTIRKADAIEFYGSGTKLADALGISKMAVSKWGEFLPELRACQLEIVTKGKLKREPIESAA